MKKIKRIKFWSLVGIIVLMNREMGNCSNEIWINTLLIIVRIITLQDEDILGQLIYGARYLDIRVGYYATEEIQWWGSHGLVAVVPFQTVVEDVKTFLDNTDEIVIFDVQEFPVGKLNFV